jgi:hypothetical protein
VNNHEGSIPFTRSIDFRALTKECSKPLIASNDPVISKEIFHNVESQEKSVLGGLRRKNLRLPMAGTVTEMKPLFVERDAATEDQSFESERSVISCN